MDIDGRRDIVVAGAINTDLVAVVDRAPEAGETVTGLSFSIFGGGKAANQAVAVRRAGSTVALVGLVGDDDLGSARLAELEKVGVDISDTAALDGMSSGVALITVENEGENRIAYVPGPTLRISGGQICRALDRSRPAIYLQPNEVPVDAARMALARARELGAITMLNAAPDPEAARPLLGDVDYLIVNRGEARTLSGFGGTMEDALSSLAARAGASIVLTAGADGVYCHHHGETIRVPAPKVDVVDTTGAGDTFCGALATRLAKGDAIAAALRWAVAAASLSATRAGAQPSIPDAAEVERFIAASGRS